MNTTKIIERTLVKQGGLTKVAEQVKEARRWLDDRDLTKLCRVFKRRKD